MGECFLGGGSQINLDYGNYTSSNVTIDNVYTTFSVILNTGKTSSQIKNILAALQIGNTGLILTEVGKAKTFTEPSSGRKYTVKIDNYTDMYSTTRVALLIASADATFSSPSIISVIGYNLN